MLFNQFLVQILMALNGNILSFYGIVLKLTGINCIMKNKTFPGDVF